MEGCQQFLDYSKLDHNQILKHQLHKSSICLSFLILRMKSSHDQSQLHLDGLSVQVKGKLGSLCLDLFQQYCHFFLVK